MLEVLYIIIALGLTVLVHELGHFLTAKALNIRVETFSIGFGPKIVSFKRGETEYQIAWLIFLGGFVKLSGENPDEVDPGDKKAFLNQHPAKKILVAASGVVQNFIFAFVLVWVVFLAGTESLRPVVGEVKKGYPAYEAGIKKGDEIYRINDKKIIFWNELTDVIAKEGRSGLEIRIKRPGPEIASKAREFTLKVKPKVEETEDFFKDKKVKPVIGVSPLPFLPVIDGLEKGYPAYGSGLEPDDQIIAVNGKKTEFWDQVTDEIEKSRGEVVIKVLRPVVHGMAAGTKEFKIKTAVKEVYNSETKQKEKVTVVGIRPKSNSTIEKYSLMPAAGRAWQQTMEFTSMTVKSIYKMILRKIQPDVAGPLGVIQISYEVAKTGLVPLIFLFAIININLALVNLLPLLPLDGGLAFMFLIEWVARRRVPLKVQETLMQFGWMLLIFLLIYFTYTDILRFVRGG
jgi:regulator of sigma E protease